MFPNDILHVPNESVLIYIKVVYKLAHHNIRTLRIAYLNVINQNIKKILSRNLELFSTSNDRQGHKQTSQTPLFSYNAHFVIDILIQHSKLMQKIQDDFKILFSSTEFYHLLLISSHV